jgi:regulator of sigma E protease
VTRQDVLIGYVEADSPADKAGLEVRDELISISDGSVTESVDSQEELPSITKQFAGQSVMVTYERDGVTHMTQVNLRSEQEVDASKQTGEQKGFLGISPTEYVLRRSTWSSPIVAAGFIGQATGATFKGLGTAISSLVQGDGQKASEQVAGPVGIFVVLQSGSLLGPEFILMIIAIISLTLAIMNVLPIPALDGGRLFVMLLFRGMKKPLTPKLEDRIHGTGFAALMVLFVVITVVDVRRFF